MNKTTKIPIDEEYIQKMATNFKKPVNNQYILEKAHFDRMMRLVSMAHALNTASQKYDTWEEANNKLYERFEELFRGHQSMYLAAIRGKLYEGETGVIVRLFQDANGDPKKALENFNKYNDDIANKAIENINRIRESGVLQKKESQKIEDVIRRHKSDN